MAFLGAKFSEEKLVGYAYAFEQISGTRKTIKPVVQPTTELKDVIAKRVNEAAGTIPEMPIQWIQNTELIEIPAQAQLLLERSGKIRAEETMLHINSVVSGQCFSVNSS